MKISKKDWQNYIARLRKTNETAANKVAHFMETHDCSTPEGVKQLIDYAHAVATKYGEGAAELSCQMLDAVADASGAYVPAAEPAATATYGEIAKAIYGTLASNRDPNAVGAAVGRSVKLAGVDTLQQNALRDGAEWAWIPAGDTCPFCLMLASRGWVKASKKAIKNGHADHIHNNCDCTYCVRYDGETTVEGYEPDKLYDQYKNAGNTPRERLNALRRQHYAANKDYINAQKRAAYARRVELKRVTGNDTINNQNKPPILQIEQLTVEQFCKIIQDDPTLLRYYTPITLKRTLDEIGAEVTPLKRGRHKGQPFEEGGGYIVNYSGNGVLEYHPAKNSRHGGKYYKLSDSENGKRWFNSKGQEIDVKATGTGGGQVLKRI